MYGKKKIKKRPGTNNAYFTQVTQESIHFFQNAELGRARDEAYEKEILPAFQKMAEYWVFSYGIESPASMKIELVQGCINFLHDSIHKWNPEKATKAFSYFNVIARNWLINAVNGQKKKKYQELSLNDSEMSASIRNNDVNERLVISSPENDLLEKEYLLSLRDRVKKVMMSLDDEKDIIVMSAIEKVFELSEQLDFMNRSAIFVYIRDISGLDRRAISKSMSRIRKTYQQVRNEELNR